MAWPKNWGARLEGIPYKGGNLIIEALVAGEIDMARIGAYDALPQSGRQGDAARGGPRAEILDAAPGAAVVGTRHQRHARTRLVGDLHAGRHARSDGPARSTPRSCACSSSRSGSSSSTPSSAEVAVSSPEEFAAFVTRERDKAGEVVKRYGIKPGVTEADARRQPAGWTGRAPASGFLHRRPAVLRGPPGPVSSGAEKPASGRAGEGCRAGRGRRGSLQPRPGAAVSRAGAGRVFCASRLADVHVCPFLCSVSQRLVITTSRYSPGTTSDCGARDVHLLEQRGDVALERLAARRIERGEGLVRRAVEVAEHLHPVRGRAVAEVEMPRARSGSARPRAPKSSTMCGSVPHSAGDLQSRRAAARGRRSP